MDQMPAVLGLHRHLHRVAGGGVAHRRCKWLRQLSQLDARERLGLFRRLAERIEHRRPALAGGEFIGGVERLVFRLEDHLADVVVVLAELGNLLIVFRLEQAVVDRGLLTHVQHAAIGDGLHARDFDISGKVDVLPVTRTIRFLAKEHVVVEFLERGGVVVGLVQIQLARSG